MISLSTRFFAPSLLLFALGGCAAPGVAPVSFSPVATKDTGIKQSIWVTENGGAVAIYSYPKGKGRGRLTGFGSAQGACADTHGNVFIADETTPSVIYEYRAGGRVPVSVFVDEGYVPQGCAVDPTTGDLAVTNLYALDYTSGTVAIYEPTGKHRRRVLTDPSIYQPMYCGYDTAGNLYVDGYSKYNATEVAVLPPNSKKFTGITINQDIAPGSIQWDGKNLAVGAPSTNLIYRYSITGSYATEVGTTTLGGVTYGQNQFWIEGSKVVATAAVDKLIGVWKYPAGGAAITTIHPKRQIPWGVAVSSPGTQ